MFSYLLLSLISFHLLPLKEVGHFSVFLIYLEVEIESESELSIVDFINSDIDEFSHSPPSALNIAILTLALVVGAVATSLQVVSS